MMQAAEQNSLEDVNWIDRQFHETLIKYSNNELLDMFWNSVAQRIQQAMSLGNQKKGDLHQIARNHLAIAKAIENADVEESIRLINEHISSLGDRLVDSWNEPSSSEADLNHS